MTWTAENHARKRKRLQGNFDHQTKPPAPARIDVPQQTASAPAASCSTEDLQDAYGSQLVQKVSV